jgi:1-acyl-sn-glycerol-3-phosphate acyltransferase
VSDRPAPERARPNPSIVRSGRLVALRESFALGYAYPVRAVAGNAFRRAPVHEKITRAWCRLLVRRYDVRLERDPASAPLLVGRRCIWICPHRSVADFFIHKEIVEGRGATLSRFLVAAVFPLIWVASLFDRSVWFFRRDRAHTREAFYRWLDRQFERCPLDGLIVYAEGHRSQGDRPLPLKAGMIRYAFRRGLPIQIVMTAHTESVLNEKGLVVRRGVAVPFRIEPPLEPHDFADERAFFQAVREAFERSFRDVAGRGGL